LSNLFSRGLKSLFGADLPGCACEFTQGEVRAVRASADRKTVVSHASAPLADGVIRPGVKDPNITDVEAVSSALGRVLGEVGFSGSELVGVIPDDSVRIGLLEVDSFPSAAADQRSFIQWKLKKHVQFNVNDAAVAWQKIGENGVVDLLTVLAPRSVTSQYEEIVDGLGLHAGSLTASTLAALNLMDTAVLGTDVLFVKLTASSVVTTILSNQKLRFYRKVPRAGALEDAVHPTLMYYQDRLSGDSGSGLGQMVLCSDLDADAGSAIAARLGLPSRPLGGTATPDAFKPALGALQS